MINDVIAIEENDSIDNSIIEEKENNAIVKVGYREYEFPSWNGVLRLDDNEIQLITKFFKGSDDRDTIENLINELIASWAKEDYYKDMLLFIQAKLDKHIYEGCNLGLCLDSSKEQFDIMITPCKTVP